MQKKLLCIAALAAVCSGAGVRAQTLPTGISGLQIWLDASDPLGNGTAPIAGALPTWEDKSGLNHDGAQYGGQMAGVIVPNQINGRAVVRFTRTNYNNGTVYNLNGVDTRAMTMPAVTIFTVYRQGAHDGDQGLWGNDDGAWDRFYFSSTGGSDNGAVSFGNQAVPTAVINNGGLIGTTRLMTAVYDRNTVNGSAIYFDGVLVTPFNDQTTLGSDARPNMCIGWDGDNNCFNGDIAEVLVYNRKLSACEIQSVNRYLSNKYAAVFSAITISSTKGASFNKGDRTVLSASTSGTAYQWFKDGALVGTGATHTTYDAGTYRVAVTNNGCADTSAPITITTPAMPAPGNALNFVGSSSNYVDLGNGTGNALLATNINSMEAWVKFNSLSGDQEILSKSTTGIGIELLTYGSQLAFFVMDGTNNCHVDYPLSNLSTGIWYHIAATWNGVNKNTMKLYVNGASVGTFFPSANTATDVADPGAGNTFKIGRWSLASPARYFSGTIDEVRIWSTERSATEIVNNLYAPLSLPATGLIAYYKFDYANPNGANGDWSYLYDYSGNGNQGTLSGFALSGTTSNWTESYAMVRPVIAAAGGVSTSGFTANWTAPASGTVDYYTLDVSTTSNFSALLPAYTNLNVGNVQSYAVTGLANNVTYYYRVRPYNTSADGLAQPSAFGTVTTGVPLLIQLLSFQAAKSGTAAELQWQATTSSNAAYFGIERSADGRSFSELQRVAAAGENYKAVDAAPLGGINYYRLRMVDADGKESYSATAQVVFGEKGASYTVYPVPAASQLFIEGGAQRGAAAITDLGGRVLMQFRLTGSSTQVSIGHLAPGTYLLQLPGAQAMKIQKQ